MNNRIISIFISLLTVFCQPALASDLSKEKRWADQVVDGIIVGDAVWLETGGNKFLGIYTENDTDEAKGAVILLHGSGVHPNWADVIQPLRSELPSYGWATLSIQMPILANDAKHDEYAPLIKEVPARLDTAINFLNNKKFKNIIIVAHSLGATMANSYLAARPNIARAYVAIGMDANADGLEELDNSRYLNKINLPLLDIYGSQDLDGVLSSTKQRRQAARKAGNENYTQVSVTGANHFFNGLDAELIRRVKSWLSNHAGRVNTVDEQADPAETPGETKK